MQTDFSLLVLLAILHGFYSTPSGAMEYYIVPNTPSDLACPQGKECYTLETIAQSSVLHNTTSNVTLMFMEGVYYWNFTIMKIEVESLYLIGLRNMSVILKMGHTRTIRIKSVRLLKMANLNLEAFSLSIIQLGSLLLQQVNAHESSVVTINMWGKLYISDTVFTKSGLHVTVKGYNSKQIITRSSFSGSVTLFRSFNRQYSGYGSLHMYIIDSQIRNKKIHITSVNLTINIQNTTISSSNVLFNALFDHSNISINVWKSTIIEGTLEILPETDSNLVINIIKSVITDSKKDTFLAIGNNYPIHTNIQVYLCTIRNSSGMLSIHGWSFIAEGRTMDISIRASLFVDNYNKNEGAILSMELPVKTRFNLLINNSLFYRNKMRVLEIETNNVKNILSQTTPVPFSIATKLSLVDVVFQDNTVYSQGEPSAIVETFNIDTILIRDCHFRNNTGTAIRVSSSDIILSGNTSFINNTGQRGGGLHIHNSYLIIQEYSHVILQNNNAHDVGGAIYYESRNQDIPESPCFYQIQRIDETKYLWELREGVQLHFINNYAEHGGKDIFGAAIHSACYLLHYTGMIELSSIELLRSLQVFHFSNETTSLISSISSNPKRVCLCDDNGTPQCANEDYILSDLGMSLFPGEHTTISAVIVGLEFGTLSSILYVQILSSKSNASDIDPTLGQGQSLQEITDFTRCANLEYSIQSPRTNQTITLVLTAHQDKVEKYINQQEVKSAIEDYEKRKVVPNQLLNMPVFINITLINCPTGFKLSTKPPYICNCHPKLKPFGITHCVISNHTGLVYRNQRVWISAAFTENDNESFVIHKQCPYDYCKTENISVDLRFPNTQCAFNHSGILCGGCQGNLSLALGTSKCLQCSNIHMSLLIPFAFAGLMLVFFIKILDLTVAKGTLNGLILYANIVWANNSILFPKSNTVTVHPVFHILHIFIAWVNLDLGIETCFINGLNGYWKTWLQFAFPLYVWGIVCVMIIAAHYSTRASKLFGNNSVPVLATLVLLSYTKLLRTIITCFGFTLLDFPQGTKVVWSFDGNIPYFSVQHAILFLVALTALLILWAPYMVILLTLQWLRKRTHHKPLRWINRLKPFFDAHFGQLKPKHTYWVGLLLLVRLVLLILFSITSAVAPSVNIFAIQIVCGGLLGYMSITGFLYKQRLLSLLEISFILNLLALGGGTLYTEVTDTSNASVVYTSIGIVFVQFIVITIYQLWVRIRTSYQTFSRRQQNTGNATHSTGTELRPMRSIVNIHSHPHYREPLLDSVTQ